MAKHTNTRLPGSPRQASVWGDRLYAVGWFMLWFCTGLFLIVAMGGCRAYVPQETDTDRLWRDPCAWRTATRQQRNVRAARIIVENHWIGEADAFEHVAATEEVRCIASM